MAEETEKTNTSDDALNQAAQITEKSQEAEETVLETQDIQDVKDVQDKGESDQQFRSRLGRRVSKIEENMNVFIQEMRLSMHNLSAKANPPPDTATSEGEYIGTASDVRRIVQQIEQEKTQKIKSYNESYLNYLARLGVDERLGEPEFKRLEELTKTSFNQSNTNFQDPIADAQINFQKAMRVMDKEKTTPQKQINLKGDIPKSTGVGSGSKMVDETEPIVKLDKYAQDFVNYHNIPKDKIQKALVRETPERLKKK